ncbi:MAG: hypothetical protein MN733_33275 [Nitrososphaera sp.]|nr:hypothetical protein [Nitrososphaera sp.]
MNSLDLNLAGRPLFDRLVELLKSLKDEDFDQGIFGESCGCICTHARRVGIVSVKFEKLIDVFYDLQQRLGIDSNTASYLFSVPPMVQMHSLWLGLPEETSFSRKDTIRRLRTIEEMVYPPNTTAQIFT